ncbi:hypothetical protein GCM10009414_03040 [Tatumella terrea]
MPEEMYPGRENYGEDVYRKVSDAKKTAIKITIITGKAPFKPKTRPNGQFSQT